MDITATDAKNRFGQVLEQAQKRPVFIEKSGRRHAVVMSVELYEQLVGAPDPGPPAELNARARRFYEKHKDWVDEQNVQFRQHGVWNEDFRSW